jgi:hypothetical protein
MKARNLVLTAIVGALLSTTALAQTTTSKPGGTSAMSDSAKRVRITYENLTKGQTLSPSVFITHNSSAPPLFKDGQKATFGLMRIAEEGNAGPLLSAEIVKKIGGPFGTAAQAISVLPGQTRTLDIEVTKDHPLISGAFMLVMTNDGFSGINAVNAYELTGPKSMDLMAYDAGTEKNNEKKSHLIAMMGTARDPEEGVITHHQGIRGDADAPASWKFDTDKPVARLTIAPLDNVTVGSGMSGK